MNQRRILPASVGVQYWIDQARKNLEVARAKHAEDALRRAGKR